MTATHASQLWTSALGAIRRLTGSARTLLNLADASAEERYLSRSVDAADLERRIRHLDAESAANASLLLSLARHTRP